MVVEEITVSMAWVRGTGLYGGACRLGMHLRNYSIGSRAAHKGFS